MEQNIVKINNRPRKTIRIIAIVLASIVLLPIVILFIGRGVYDVRLRLPDGVREKGYIELGGVQQYINIRGADASNPVIIYLHGGGGGTTYITPFQQMVEADYTFIYWSQRDGGITYVKSPDAEIPLECFITDLDELVDYAAKRFGQPIILVGHSGGSRIGTVYANAHPEKIAGFIGIGQVVDVDFIERVKFDTSKAASFAREKGNEQDAIKIEELLVVWQDYLKDHHIDQPITDANMIEKLDELEPFLFKNFPDNPAVVDNPIKGLMSPDFGWDSLRWELALRGIKLGVDIDKYYEKLDMPDEDYSRFEPPDILDVPVVIINGSEDMLTPAVFAQEYYDRLTAPEKEIFIIQGAGHFPMEEVDYMELFAETLKTALKLVLAE